MSRYEVRLEAPDGSGHFRVVRLDAADEHDARRQCERKELELVLFELPAEARADICKRHDVSSIDELPAAPPLDAAHEDNAAFRALPKEDRAHLHAHYQEKPYEVVSVTEWER